MKKPSRIFFAALALLILILLLPKALAAPAEQDSGIDRAPGVDLDEPDATLTLVGRVINSQEAAVDQAEVRIFVSEVQQILTVADEEAQVARTDAIGFYSVDLALPRLLIETDTIAVEITKPGFRVIRQGLARQSIAHADDHYYASVPHVVLPRIFNPAFFIATAIFIVVFGSISLNLLHETIAAFLGAAAMLGVSYFIGTFNSDFWIISFHRAITFVDFDVIFLLMTMMIFMAIMSDTGIFQWIAFRTFRLGRGSAFIVTAILICITGVFSSVLNDTTVMLLMTPVSIQIALALNIHQQPSSCLRCWRPISAGQPLSSVPHPTLSSAPMWD